MKAERRSIEGGVAEPGLPGGASIVWRAVDGRLFHGS